MRLVPALLLFFASALGLGSAVSPLAAQTTLRAGIDYAVISTPVATSAPTKIEVANLFRYNCPQCLQFESAWQGWRKRQLADVQSVAYHMVLSPTDEPLARGYFTMLQLKLVDRAHQAAFSAVNLERRPLSTAEAWAEFLSAHGTDKAVALSTFSSFAVTSRLRSAQAFAQRAGIKGIPEVIVNGKFRVTPAMAGSLDRMLVIVDFLVAQERRALVR